MFFAKWEAVRKRIYISDTCEFAFPGAFWYTENDTKRHIKGGETMKAKALREQDMAQRGQAEALTRQTYYYQLRDALYDELMQQGFCEMLEELLLDWRGAEAARIYVLDYAALMECHSMIVGGKKPRDATEFVPHLNLRGERAAWAALDQPGAFLMPVPQDMPEKMRQLRAGSRQLVDARDDTLIPQADDAALREVDQVHALNKLLDDRCRALQRERDELQNRLRLLEEGVITEQVRYAIEARRLQEEEALRQSYEAQREAAKAAFREQYAEEQAADRLRREHEAADMAELRTGAAVEYGAVRREMAGDLAGLMQIMQEKITAWETGLERAEALMLAKSYVALHDLCSKGADALVLEAKCTGAADSLVGAAMDMQRQLRDRVQQLEQAMLRLGLTVLRPREGEPYDGAYHVPADVSAGAAGNSVIARCVHPGVMAQGAREALLRAEVELK